MHTQRRDPYTHMSAQRPLLRVMYEASNVGAITFPVYLSGHVWAFVCRSRTRGNGDSIRIGLQRDRAGDGRGRLRR